MADLPSRLAAIRVDDRYGGTRVTLHGELGKARLRVQVDVGIGDVVVPAPEWLEYPSLLAFARPRLRAYHRETVVLVLLLTGVGSLPDGRFGPDLWRPVSAREAAWLTAVRPVRDLPSDGCIPCIHP